MIDKGRVLLGVVPLSPCALHQQLYRPAGILIDGATDTMLNILRAGPVVVEFAAQKIRLAATEVEIRRIEPARRFLL